MVYNVVEILQIFPALSMTEEEIHSDLLDFALGLGGCDVSDC